MAIVLLLQRVVLVEVNQMILLFVVRSRNSDGLLVHLCVEIEQTLGRLVNNQRQASGPGGVLVVNSEWRGARASGGGCH